MLYGGALAQAARGHIWLFGHHFEAGLSAYLSVVVAGVAGNTARRGRQLGPSARYGGHSLLERHGRNDPHDPAARSSVPSAGSSASAEPRFPSASQRP